MSARYTVCDLRQDVAKVNDWAEKDGFPVRLECGGRNGYQAVDEYPVNVDGARVGSGVNRTVQTGSSKDCGFAALDWYSNCSRKYNHPDSAACPDLV